MYAKLIAALIGAALAYPTVALADKSQANLTNPIAPPGSDIPHVPNVVGPGWVNGASKGKVKGDDKCKIQIQMKGLTLPDTDQAPCSGDEIICITHSHVTVGGTPLDTTGVFRGEVSGGSVKIKRDLFAEGTGCMPTGSVGGSGIQQYDGNTTCFEMDGGYPAPPIGMASCGLEGVYPLGFGPIPASPVIAVDGLLFK